MINVFHSCNEKTSSLREKYQNLFRLMFIKSSPGAAGMLLDMPVFLSQEELDFCLAAIREGNAPAFLDNREKFFRHYKTNPQYCYIFTQNGVHDIYRVVWSSLLNGGLPSVFLEKVIQSNIERWSGLIHEEISGNGTLIMIGGVPVEKTTPAELLCQKMNLDQSVQEVLYAASLELRYSCVFPVINSGESKEKLGFFMKAFGFDEQRLTEFFGLKNFIDVGMFSSDWYFYGLEDFPSIQKMGEGVFSKAFISFLTNTSTKISLSDLAEKLFKSEIKDDGFSLDDFSYINDNILKIRKTLAISDNSSILLWGSPGTGKSQLANALARDCGSKVVKVENVTKPRSSPHSFLGEGRNPGRLEKLQAVMGLSFLFDGSIIIVDEAEDILKNSENKVTINNSFDMCKVKSIWIINDIKGVDASFLRRFDFICQIPPMDHSMRLNLAKNLLAKHPVKDQEKENLSRYLANTSKTQADVANAINWCRKTGDFSLENIEFKVKEYSNALTKSAAAVQTSGYLLEMPFNFKPKEYIACSKEKKMLAGIVAQYQETKKFPARGCLISGESGSGKTHFAVQLVHALGLPVFYCKTANFIGNTTMFSDLSEDIQNLASPCVVMFDEVDTIANRPLITSSENKGLSEFLEFIDGANSIKDMFIIGITSEQQAIDSAVTRAGRLSMAIHIGTHGLSSVKEMVKEITPENKNLKNSYIAGQLTGYRTSEIISLLKDCKDSDFQDRHAFLNKTICFLHNQRDLKTVTSPKRTHYHEAGHILAAWLCGFNFKWAFVNRNEGFTKFSHGGKKELPPHHLAFVTMAGMAAEELFYPEHPAVLGSDDLKQLWRQVSHAYYGCGFGTIKAGLLGSEPPVSNETRQEIESEIFSYIDQVCYMVREEMENHIDVLESIASSMAKTVTFDQKALDKILDRYGYTKKMKRNVREWQIIH